MHPEADPAASNRHESVPCPRCAYDLSGVTERWRRDGLDGGQCSECGLHVTWESLDASSKQEKQHEISRAAGFFEMGRDRLVTRFITTSLRTTFPPSLFPWITKRQRIRWSRLWAFLSIWLSVWFVLAFAQLFALKVSGADAVTVDVLMFVCFAELAVLFVVWATSVLGVLIFTNRSLRPKWTSLSTDHLARTAIYALCGLLCIDAVLLGLRMSLLVPNYLLGSMASGGTEIFIYALGLLACALYLYGWSMSWCASCCVGYFRVRKADAAWAFPLLVLPLAVAVMVFILAY